ncbi:glycosyltransferase family 4 protein [Sphaerisporangium sp. TRM90804]|uniref:glycosyltransferase family 4 protein n=1 Tax=Sphaerisporangium sp. TRM90804 TaxID=3031113 RepID=UPI002449E6EA|nr:glycosyltransferase family 4 protein [Sphaerisporangium sp. TRM90804]MDH2429986.1 glycosyltransferase family 4 protein [Sphaerisporangium sp. TRM90804]
MLTRGRRIVIRGALGFLALINRIRALRAPAPDTSTVRILLLHAYGMGGTIRTSINLAGHLARTRDVEIISLVRTAEEPFFTIPPGVRVTFLDDRTVPRGRVAQYLARRPSRLVPPEEKAYGTMNLLTDLRLVLRLRRMRSGVVIGTRPGINLILTLFAPPGVLTVGQEHVTYDSHAPELQAAIKRRYGRFDAFATLTEADLKHYRKALKARPPKRLVRIPNAVPHLAGDVSSLEEKVVIGIGRFARAKGFDRLVNAWKTVAAAHPDWVLRIYGAGLPEREERLRTRIDDAGLAGSVQLMGSSPEIGVELSKSSIYAVSSRYEGFGMTILEAMSKGVPVVSFDCPHGPREIISHEHDGLLVRSEKAAALGAAISRVIDDEALRREMGANALRTASAYRMDVIGPRWEALLADLETPGDAEPEPAVAG